MPLLLLWLEWLAVLEVVVEPLCELCLLPMAFKYVYVDVKGMIVEVWCQQEEKS